MRAVGVATGETPEWIASQTDALLTELGQRPGFVLGRPTKEIAGGDDPGVLNVLVQHFAVRDRPTAAHPDGESLPGDGYSFIVSSSGTGVDLEVHVTAGADVLADRLPMHTLGIKLRQKIPGSVTGELGGCRLCSGGFGMATVDTETG